MKSIRRLLWALGAAIVLLGTGALYQSLSVHTESSRFRPHGTLVQISPSDKPRRLHLICKGEGAPVIIFEHSTLGNADSSLIAREELSKYTRVCSYDRAGMGWSDSGKDVLTAGALADDLENLIRSAQLRPSFILVPASIGGITAEMFTRKHPEEVAGLVFVDAGNSQLASVVREHLSRLETLSVCLLPWAARVGLLRLADPLNLRKEDGAEEAVARIYRAEPMATLCGIARGLNQSFQELEAAPPLPADIPLVVLIHHSPDGLIPAVFATQTAHIDAQWHAAQRAFAARSRAGAWRVVPGSTHLIGSRNRTQS